MSLNIFHIVSGKKWSGVEQYVYDLASELKRIGNYVEIVTHQARKHNQPFPSA